MATPLDTRAAHAAPTTHRCWAVRFTNTLQHAPRSRRMRCLVTGVAIGSTSVTGAREAENATPASRSVGPDAPLPPAASSSGVCRTASELESVESNDSLLVRRPLGRATGDVGWRDGTVTPRAKQSRDITQGMRRCSGRQNGSDATVTAGALFQMPSAPAPPSPEPSPSPPPCLGALVRGLRMRRTLTRLGPNGASRAAGLCLVSGIAGADGRGCARARRRPGSGGWHVRWPHAHREGVHRQSGSSSRAVCAGRAARRIRYLGGEAPQLLQQADPPGRTSCRREATPTCVGAPPDPHAQPRPPPRRWTLLPPRTPPSQLPHCR